MGIGTTVEVPPDDPVNTMPPLPKAAALGLQHVMVMYAGAVTIPLIVGGALGLSKADIAVLINADLLCCGIVSIIQAYGLGSKVGIRLPVMMCRVDVNSESQQSCKIKAWPLTLIVSA